MLTLQQLRQDPAHVKARLAKKHFARVALVDAIIALDDQRKKLQLDGDNLQAKINTLSKEIGMLMAKGQREEAEARKQEVASLKASLQPLAEQLSAAETQLHNELVLLPNLPSEKVPEGRTPSDNEVVREAGEIPVLAQGAQAHWDLIRTYDLVDFEAGAKITGSGFPLYKGKGAKLQRALIQYFLDENTAAGYTEYLPPLMVNEASAYGTGQLPDKEGQMYHMPLDNLY
ncbi:MAG: serine--tRNA ligase, partial [Sphingomonadales bacterium]